MYILLKLGHFPKEEEIYLRWLWFWARIKVNGQGKGVQYVI
jgi:hypothetical protein